MNGTSLIGRIQVGNEVLSLEDLDRMLSDTTDLEELKRSMKDLNGFYSFVHVSGDHVIAAVDRIRGFPLFYGHSEKGIYCSDDAFWIQDQIGDLALDEVAVKELRLSGYVTKDRTLSPRIAQVQAGDMVRLSLGMNDVARVETYPYQRYRPGNYRHQDLETSLKELDTVMVASFQRLIAEAKGRALVVPLSGGYDSRLIVLMLKRLGYENVIAFSYGRPENGESRISKEIARHLGIRWEFVEYNNEKWRSWYQSAEHDAYRSMGSGLASLPHIQDWPAIKVLKEEGRIPEDSIFLPGHTIVNPSQYANLQKHSVKEGKEPAGGASSKVGVKERAEEQFIEQLVDDLIKDNYNLPGRPIDDAATLRKMRVLVLSSLDYLDQGMDYVSAYEGWNFRERQVKFIFNSIRAYEYWGYQWWLPLLDNEFMEFWRRLTLKQRYDKCLIRVYTDRLSKELMKDFRITHYEKTLQKKRYDRLIKMVLKRRTVSWLLGLPYNYHKKRTMYDQDPQAYFGMMTRERYDKEYTGREFINYYVASDYIDWVNNRTQGK